MSEPEGKKVDERPPRRVLSALLAVVGPALIAGVAAFGGARLSTAYFRFPGWTGTAHAAVVAPPPGPTVSLEPFVLVTPDTAKHMHAMRVTIAIEFDAKAKEEVLKAFTPRIRDAALAYLRGLGYEDALDSGNTDRVREDLLERIRGVGATGATRVLITDLVLQ
jgi:flagellar basal body-associated protein FliL